MDIFIGKGSEIEHEAFLGEILFFIINTFW
jgi:hypothetical protein